MRRILGSTAAVGGAVAAVLLTAGPALAAPAVTVSPASNLNDGSKVTVSAKGFPASSSLFVVECNAKAATDPGTVHCDLGNVVPLTTDSTGAGTATFSVKTGAIGDGTCAAGSSGCLIAVGPASGSNTTNTGGAPISFASAATAPSSSPSAAPSTSTTGGSTTSGSTTGGAVAGATSTSTGKPFGLELGLGAALIAAGLGAGAFALRRRVNA